MRLRNVKGSRDTIASHEAVIQDVARYKGQWKMVFGSDRPIFIEVGMGKGKFILEMARRHPEYNFIGIEKYSSVLVRALEKYEQFKGDNLVFVRMDAEYICEGFERDEISGIYLNFSDPWPKDRHARRRLTSVEYWARYNHFLKHDGLVVFKTDNRMLFDFSLEQVSAANWELVDYTFDLHHSAYIEGNVMTEYEERFTAKGNPICRLTARRDEETYALGGIS